MKPSEEQIKMLLKVLTRGIIEARSHTLQNRSQEASIILDVIHNIPGFLVDWNEKIELCILDEEIRRYIEAYPESNSQLLYLFSAKVVT